MGTKSGRSVYTGFWFIQGSVWAGFTVLLLKVNIHVHVHSSCNQIHGTKARSPLLEKKGQN
jgi:hypothetical protein